MVDDPMMAAPGHGDQAASLDAWLDAYEIAYADPAALADLPCPTCGSDDLHLRFISFGSDTLHVMPAFWCGTCMLGLPPARALLPDWAEPVHMREADLPHFRIVQGTLTDMASGGGDGE
jgi:hypothetical protein